jgi:hypothetical protein
VNSAQLAVWLGRRPFEPFRIVMSDSGVIDVYHPDQVIPLKTTALIGRRATPHDVAERDVTIALLHIVRLEPIKAVS